MDVGVGLWRKLSIKELMLLNCGVGEDSWESLGQQSVLNTHWKDWCWSWNSNTLTTWCKELTHLKRPWCWESLKTGGVGANRWWDGWMASPTRSTSVWASRRHWWSLACFSPLGLKELDMTEGLTELENGTNEPIYKTEIESQMSKTNLWLPRRKR